MTLLTDRLTEQEIVFQAPKDLQYINNKQISPSRLSYALLHVHVYLFFQHSATYMKCP